MKGYFSKLAQQTGLRLLKEGKNTPPLSAAKKSVEIAPLHREETILVSPDLPKTETPQKFEKPKRAESNQTKSVAPEISEAGKSQPIAKAENQPAKEYFKKTAEFLEKGAADEQEIGQILLREVQEWAADSPASVEIREVMETPIEKATEDVQTMVVSLPAEIFAREPSTAKNDETQVLEEQNFSLSIGTISIVIEGAEKPVSAPEASPKTKIQNTAQAAEQRSSRLSRYYL